MKNRNGYTIVELIVVIAVVGVIAFVAINKASYAFSDSTEAEKELYKQQVNLIETQAVRYAEDHQEIFEEANSTYIRVSDLIENNYLLTDNEGNVVSTDNIEKNQKIQLTLKDDKISAHLE